jgi:hypothetical protein
MVRVGSSNKGFRANLNLISSLKFAVELKLLVGGLVKRTLQRI